MANVAFLSGWYVVRKCTDTDPVVVARRAAASGGIDMIIGARAESARGMAVATILVTGSTRIVRIGWHVRIEKCGKWFACGSNAMAGLAIVHDISMIKDSISKTFCIVAPTTILGSGSMSISIGGRCSFNARASVMAGLTGLVRCIQQGVVENTAGHFETHDAMACFAIDVCYRMADRRITCLVRCGNAMTGIAPEVRDNGGGVVGVGIQKTGCGMTGTAFRVGVRVVARWDVGWGGRLTYGHGAVVATGACSNNS